MRSHAFAAALVLAAAPYVAAQDRPADRPKDNQVTIKGCVVPGENNTYVMTNVEQSPAASGAVLPDAAHGRRVLFWLKNDADVKSHPNQMVEVTGTFTDLKESEIELKAGTHKDGGLVVEFEGPGRDVTASNQAVGAAVGTSGRQTAEKNDIKTYLAEVDVKAVKVVDGSCR